MQHGIRPLDIEFFSFSIATQYDNILGSFYEVCIKDITHRKCTEKMERESTSG